MFDKRLVVIMAMALLAVSSAAQKPAEVPYDTFIVDEPAAPKEAKTNAAAPKPAEPKSPAAKAAETTVAAPKPVDAKSAAPKAVETNTAPPKASELKAVTPAGVDTTRQKKAASVVRQDTLYAVPAQKISFGKRDSGNMGGMQVGAVRRLPGPVYRVVSLDPSVSSIIMALGVDSAVIGVNSDGYVPAVLATRPVAGSIRYPQTSALELLKPNYVFVSPHCKNVPFDWKQKKCAVVQLAGKSVSAVFGNIHKIAAVFELQQKADSIVAALKQSIVATTRVAAQIPSDEWVRAVYVEDIDHVVTAAGSDAIATDLIEAAGGLGAIRDSANAVAYFSPAAWAALGATVVIYPQEKPWIADSLKRSPHWSQSPGMAVRRIIAMPQRLMLYPGAEIAEAVSLLSLKMYQTLHEQELLRKRPFVATRTDAVQLFTLPYVSATTYYDFERYGFPAKALVVRFKKRMHVVTDVLDQPDSITTLCIASVSPQIRFCETLLKKDTLLKSMCGAFGFDARQSMVVLVDVALDALVRGERKLKDKSLYGFTSVALDGGGSRAGVAGGGGRVELIMMSNCSFSPQSAHYFMRSAMKTGGALFQELDIRALPDPVRYAATGVALEHYFLIEGDGLVIRDTTHLREMETMAVGLTSEMLSRSLATGNGIARGRSVQRRLAERAIISSELVNQAELPAGVVVRLVEQMVDSLLSIGQFAELMHTAFVVQDAMVWGQFATATHFRELCLGAASRIAGRPCTAIGDYIPRTMKNDCVVLGLNALIEGIVKKTLPAPKLSDSATSTRK